MSNPIGFRETTTEAAASPASPREAVALRFDPSRRVTLRFELELVEVPQGLEALSYARRAMIREERIRGLEWDEPHTELRWLALASQAAWCRQKVEELVARANRALDELHAGAP